MDIHTLGFAKIVLLSHDIAEIIIDEGVVLNLTMVNEYHEFIVQHLQAPFSLLINKINDYSYDFDAQMKIGNIPQIHAMAVVTYTRKSAFSTHLLTDTTPREIKWNIQVFPQRAMALEWLEYQQQQLRLSTGNDYSELIRE
jgi:hypothetical protein